MPEPVLPRAVLRHAALADIDPRTLYLLAKLRQDVFSLEQQVTDPDLDGRDLEPTTTLLWLELPGPEAEACGLDGEPVAHLRILRDPAVTHDSADSVDSAGAAGSAHPVGPAGIVRIGRVAVRAQNRRGGVGRQLMSAALAHARETAPGAEVHIDAQAYLEQWYAGMGFETVGGVFMEAGIEHVAMVLRVAQP